MWALHQKFHEKLRWFIKLLVDATEGKIGDTPEARDVYKSFVEFILACDAKNAKYLFNGVSLDNWVANTADKIIAEIKTESGEIAEVKGSDVTPQVVALLKKGKKMFSKDDLFEGLPRWAAEFILNDAVAFLSGFRALTTNWQIDKAAWQKDKDNWEAERADYMHVRPKLAEFDKANALNFSFRRKRWDKYIEFLKANPELAAWRGQPAVINHVSEADQERIKNAGNRERSGARAKGFFNANPELKALDSIHAEYEKRFAPRTRKIGGKYLETDGFKLKPGFTLPDAAQHPRWLSINSENTNPVGYQNLVLPSRKNAAGEISIRMLEERGEGGFKHFKFKGDNRLSQITSELVKVERKKRISENTEFTGDREAGDKGAVREKRAYTYYDDKTQMLAPAEIKSARLRFAINSKNQPYRVYLDFSVKRDTAEPSELAKNVTFVPVKLAGKSKSQTNTPDAVVKVPKRIKLPDDITVAFIHFGISTAAYAVLATGRDGEMPIIIDSRKLWLSHENNSGWTGEPKIRNILSHDRELRQMASNRPQLAKGEKFAPGLREHINNMEMDRYKKTCRRIIDYAINREQRTNGHGVQLPRADIIIMGDFTGIEQSGENPRRLNRMIQLWKQPKMVELLKDLAPEAGLKCFETSSWGISTVCSRCSEIGKRFLVTKEKEKKSSQILFSKSGRHFACPACGYRENAEKNASLNLANIIFYGKDWLNNLRKFFDLGTREKAGWHHEIEERLLTGEKSLEKMISK